MGKAMNPTTKSLRDAVKHIDDTWVWVFRDGTKWVGSTRRSTKATAEVKAALEAAGYRCECNGTPGTSGEFIIDVVS
jgi:hypothetical protein